MSKEYVNQQVLLAKEENLDSIEFIYSKYSNLVNKISHSFLKEGVEIQDLQQEGYLGIHKAIEKFDIQKNVSFTTYVYSWILNYISEYARQHSKTIRIPNHIIHSNKKVNKYKNDFWERYKRWPTDKQICKKLNLTLAKLKNIYGIHAGIVELDSKVYEDGEEDYSNHIPAPVEKPNKYVQVFDILSEEERDILEYNSGYCGPKMTYKALAKQYGRSFQEVKSGIDKSKRRIRKELRKIK